jgi:peptidoglycan/xylan/chitin deacetylase (PgdA/CDA1 family)
VPRFKTNVWPNGARIAVVFQIPLEVWGDDVQYALSYVPKLPAEIAAKGVPDLLTESFKAYAGEVGIWRLIDLLDRHEVPAMGVFNGKAAEDFSDAAKAFRQGHPEREIAAHGWRQDVYSFALEGDEMRDNVKRTADAIEAATGERPVGWVSPGGQFTPETIEILAESGFIYHGDYAHSDAADVIDVGGRKLVRMAVPWEVNDYWTWALTFQPPSAFVELFKRSFDVLYREGGQIVGAVAHSGLYGHPFGVSAFEEVVEYVKAHDDVWITTRRDIARWVLEHEA